jgi:hypothetical protein
MAETVCAKMAGRLAEEVVEAMSVCTHHCGFDLETASVGETHERELRWARAAGRVDEISDRVRGEGKGGGPRT